MAKRTLTLLEAAGIQEYVFGSNQLAQNIGASELVALSTTKWVVDKLNGDENIGPEVHNASWDGTRVTYNGNSLKDGLKAEVVYAGGGNSMILFAECDQAKRFTEKLTLYLLKHVRGLQLIVAHQEFEYGDEPLSAVHKKLRGKVAARKLNRPFSTPMLGLSVTANCVYTGLPAIGLDTDATVVGHDAAQKASHFDDDYIPRLISQTVADKLRVESIGKERLHTILPQVREQKQDGQEYGFIYDFDELGSRDESSYIAVIHADGNQIGKRFEHMAKIHPNSADNDSYVATLRRFSETMQKKSKRALGATVDYLFSSLVDMQDGTEKFGGVVPIPRTKKGNPLLPFRPIVFGGDDVTFVCDGRLGLDLAAKYLQEFSKADTEEGELEGGAVFARAGVAVVKTHYPFSRAYELAERLAAHAKNEIPALKSSNQPSATVIDWHFATTGMMFDIAEIRQREYMEKIEEVKEVKEVKEIKQVEDVETFDETKKARVKQSLQMRPLLLDKGTHTWRTWANFTSIMNDFQKKGGVWAGKRNKMKALRDALRGGKTAVNLFLTNYSLDKLPKIEGVADSVRRSGWENGRCGYFDAIEATDYFVSLKRKEEEESQ